MAELLAERTAPSTLCPIPFSGISPIIKIANTTADRRAPGEQPRVRLEPAPEPAPGSRPRDRRRGRGHQARAIPHPDPELLERRHRVLDPPLRQQPPGRVRQRRAATTGPPPPAAHPLRTSAATTPSPPTRTARQSTNTAHIAPNDQVICGIAPVHPPRDPRGDNSARNEMLAAISAPIATPIKTRTTNSIHTSVTTADTSASPTNATRFNTNTRRRPIRSARSPKNRRTHRGPEERRRGQPAHLPGTRARNAT